MKKTTLTVLIGLFIILVAGAIYFASLDKTGESLTQGSDTVATTTDGSGTNTDSGVQGATSPKNATYIIEGQTVTLKDGVSATPAAPGSASMITTRYFGNEVMHDLDGDGRADTVFLLTQNTGGSGTFYYVVAALNKAGGYVGSAGVLLGDRIAPQSTNMGTGNIVIVNYADRKAGQSFAVPPSVGKSISLLLDTKTMQFGEVAQNFEGEANPAVMKLNMHTWQWVNTTYSDGTVIKPRVPSKFTLTFKPATAASGATPATVNSFSASTDCNGVGGEYKVSGSKITFDKMMSTLMYCEGSQEQDFSKGLTAVQSFHFTSKGELVFDLKMDSGTMLFK